MALDTLEQLISISSSQDEYIRYLAAQSLSQTDQEYNYGRNRGINTLEQLISSSQNKYIRYLAAQSLSQIDRAGHFSVLRTKITDIDILIKSLRDLGIRFKTNAECRGHKGQMVRCDIVAVLEGYYDLGWSQNNDDTFDLIADLAGVDKKYNHEKLITSINQKYAVNKSLADAERIRKKRPGRFN